MGKLSADDPFQLIGGEHDFLMATSLRGMAENNFFSMIISLASNPLRGMAGNVIFFADHFVYGKFIEMKAESVVLTQVDR